MQYAPKEAAETAALVFAESAESTNQQARCRSNFRTPEQPTSALKFSSHPQHSRLEEL